MNNCVFNIEEPKDKNLNMLDEFLKQDEKLMSWSKEELILLIQELESDVRYARILVDKWEEYAMGLVK